MKAMFSPLDIPKSVTVDALNFGWFIFNAPTALAVIIADRRHCRCLMRAVLFASLSIAVL